MELKDLVGIHKLSGVDFENIEIEKYGCFEDAQMMRFRLDNIIYVITEDPSDGYRSSMKDIIISKDKIKNKFKSIDVLGIYEEGKYGDLDILKLVSTKTGGTIIEVGTDHSDSYYPCFIANFKPENIK
jgi:hypothetical protein